MEDISLLDKYSLFSNNLNQAVAKLLMSISKGPLVFDKNSEYHIKDIKQCSKKYRAEKIYLVTIIKVLQKATRRYCIALAIAEKNILRSISGQE